MVSKVRTGSIWALGFILSLVLLTFQEDAKRFLSGSACSAVPASCSSPGYYLVVAAATSAIVGVVLVGLVEAGLLVARRSRKPTAVGLSSKGVEAAPTEEELAAIARAQAERKQKLEEESRERERQKELARAYHDELISKVYNPWCQKEIEGRASLAGYPPTQDQPEYVWIPIGFELESGSDSKAHPELPMIRDALAHLDDETSEARKDVWDGMVDYNDSVKALVRWPNYIAKVIGDECGLRKAAGIGQSPKKPGCDISALVEYFDRHYYRGEEARVGPPFKGAASSSGWTFLPVHYAGLDRTLASSSDDSDLARLAARIDSWGKYYADARRSLDAKRGSLSTQLKTFQSGIAQLVQTLRIRPHLVKGKCSIEESFAQGKKQDGPKTGQP